MPEMVITPSFLRLGGTSDPGSQSQNQSEVFSHWSEKTHDEDLWSESGNGKKSINLPNIIAAVFPSVSEAPIRLQGKAITHVFESMDEIMNSVKSYYVTETLKQIYKIVGSLDFVGNPTMVLNSFVTGVRDFFITPSKEFLRAPKNPSRVGMGVAKGTLSLLSHSASGLFGFAAKMTASAGQAAATLSFDAEYTQWHRDMIVAEAKNLDRQWKRRGVGGISTILARPVFDIVRGVALGTTGLIVSPIQGAKKEGGVGFAKGIVIGTVGVFTKPLVGIFDAFTHFTGSIHDVAKSVNVLEKRFQPPKKIRLPYTFGLRNVLVPFNQLSARSAALLRKHHLYKKGLRAKVRTALVSIEVHVASEILVMEPGVETVVIVSNLRIVLLKVTKDSSGTLASTLRWEVYLFGNSIIKSRVQEHGHNGVALTISRSNPSVSEAEQHTHDRREEDKEAQEMTTLKGDVSIISVETENIEKHNWDEGSNDGSQPESVSAEHYYKAAETNGDDDVEWFTLLAEFHHRKQLSRLHNAICCVTGNIDAIIMDHGLNKDDSGEGYTSFGEFFFSRDEGNEKAVDFEMSYRSVLDEIEFVPWIPEIFFVETAKFSKSDRNIAFQEMRRAWNLEKEKQSSLSTGGPAWIVQARAEAIFIPERPPFIPKDVVHSSAINSVFLRLEHGDISFNEAFDMIDGYLKEKAKYSTRLLEEGTGVRPWQVHSLETFDTAPRAVYGNHTTSSDLLADSSDRGPSLSHIESVTPFDSIMQNLKEDGGHKTHHMDIPTHLSEDNFLTSGNLPIESKVTSKSTPEMLHNELSLANDDTGSPFVPGTVGGADGSYTRDRFLSASGGSRSRVPSRGGETDMAYQSLLEEDRSTSGSEEDTKTKGSRLEKMEGMLEQLLKLSMEQGGQIQTAQQTKTLFAAEPNNDLLYTNQTAFLHLQKELTHIKVQMAAREANEEKTISELRREIADLRIKLSTDGSQVLTTQSLSGGTGSKNSGTQIIKSALKSPSSVPNSTARNATTSKKTSFKASKKLKTKIGKVFSLKGKDGNVGTNVNDSDADKNGAGNSKQKVAKSNLYYNDSGNTRLKSVGRGNANASDSTRLKNVVKGNQRRVVNKEVELISPPAVPPSSSSAPSNEISISASDSPMDMSISDHIPPLGYDYSRQLSTDFKSL
mmetsp:Transcript_7066/g.10134  ORF Transcript_7066/g.10134 Transcript_7066/m.10134 type:complete len:1164 (-) Transcript_7066:299-3790(-)